MSYVDFAVAISFFLFFFAIVLTFSTNYFSNLSALVKTSEFRSVSENLFTVFFERKGIPENWDEDYSIPPVKVGLAGDLYRVSLIVKETSGYNRTYEHVSKHMVFDENCENKAFNDTVRIFNEDDVEVIYRFSNETFCSGQFLKEADIIWEVNISANQNKRFSVYYSPDRNITSPNYTVNFTNVGLWNFDEGSGDTTNDTSGYGNDGTLYGGLDNTGWTNVSKIDYCLDFDGSNDYVEVSESASLNLSQEITVEAWFKLSNLTDTNPIVRKGSPLLGDVNEDGIVNKADSDIVLDHYVEFPSGPPYPRYDVNEDGFVDGKDNARISLTWQLRKATWFLQIQNESGNHKLVFSLGNSTQTLQLARVVSSKIFTSNDEGNWFHVAGTYNGSTIALYINGSLDNSTSASGSFISNESLRIGAENPNGRTYINYFDGSIDEVKIWNRSLTPEEINASYHLAFLNVNSFPEEYINALLSSKFDALKNMSYNNLKKTIGDYKFRISVGDDAYGGNINLSANVGCQESPKILQNTNGTISKVTAKVCVWK